MGAGEIRAGRAYVELNVQDRLSRGLARAAARLKAFGATVNTMGIGMMAAGAAVLTPLLGAAKVFGDMGDSLWEMSQRTGLSVEALSELGFAAEQSGTSLEAVEKSVRLMQKTIAAAGTGSKTAKDALARLGLTFRDLEGLDPERQFMLLLAQLSKIEDPTARAATALKVFGRAGTSLLPMIHDGIAGLEAFRQQARDLGIVISTEDAAKADEFKDTLNILWRVLKQVAFTVGSALAPVLIDAAKWLTVHVKRVTDWIRQNKGLVASLLKIVAGTIAAGAGLVVLGRAIQGAGMALGILSSVISVVTTVLGALASVIAWIMTPMGAVLTIAAALGAVLLYTSGAGATALSWLGKRFGDLKADALKAFQGISDALAAGDIGLAAQILWLTLKKWWLQGVGWLLSIWQPVEKFFLESWYGLQSAWEIMQHGLVVAMIETVAALKQAWASFSAFARQTWETATDWIAKRMLEIQGQFDKTLDVAGAKSMIDLEATVTKEQIEAEKSAQKKQIEETRAGSQGAEANRHEERMTELDRKSADLADRQAEQLAKNEEEIRKATEAWNEAIRKAAEERAAAEAEKPGLPKMPKFDLAPVMAELSKKMSVRGTFNVAAIQGLMGGDAIERTADAAEETAENTRKMLDELEEMEGMEFAP